MNRKVLIVDDDPAMLRLLEKYVTENGFDVLQATNGRDALELVLAEAPPIVITDWMMPEMDGVELCRALRQHEGVRFVYIIIVTAHSEIDRVTEAFEAGVDDFVSKPFRRPELVARLRAGEHIARLEDDLMKRTCEVHHLNAEMASANEKLKRMATTDELTGLLNRREAMNRLKELWASKERYGTIFSCIMLDIDFFKKFNDTYGHAAGDAVLRATAGVLQANVRTTDLVCRMGGEEFLVLCPSVRAREAGVCAEHLRAAVEAHDYAYDGIGLRVAVSLGVAEWDADMTKSDELLRKADDALYLSKQSGRNRVTIAGEATPAAAR